MASQTALNNLEFGNYAFFAVVALLGYEHLITLNLEVSLFWKKQFSGASLLFFLNRYLTIAWAIATAASPYYSSAKVGVERSVIFPRQAPTTPKCMQSARGLQSVECFLYLPWAVFSALRVYALGRSRSLAVLVFLLSMMPSIAKFAATFCIMLMTGLPDHSPDCRTVQGPITKRLANTFTIVSRTSLITAELIVLVVTWITTYTRGALISQKGERRTVTHVVLFNGESSQPKPAKVQTLTNTGRAMLLLNCLQLGFTLAAVGPTRKVLNVSEVTTFSEPITSVLITQFLFDLQRVNQRAAMHLADFDGHDATAHSDIIPVSPNTLRFRGMFDSLGSVLVWEDAESTDDGIEYETGQ